MAIDHDQIFKSVIEACFRAFFELFLPEEAKLFDFSRVEFLREEFFTDAARGKRARLDIVSKVGLRTGGHGAVLVHVEFEASRKDEDFPARMFAYFAQLRLRHQTRQMLSVAMFSDDARWKAPIPDHFEIGAAGRRTNLFSFQLIKLKHLDYRLCLDSGNPLAYALMSKMNYNRRQRVRLKAEFLRLMLGCPLDAARQSLLSQFHRHVYAAEPGGGGGVFTASDA